MRGGKDRRRPLFRLALRWECAVRALRFSFAPCGRFAIYRGRRAPVPAAEGFAKPSHPEPRMGTLARRP